MILKIIQAGEPVLRSKARAMPRKEILSGETQQLIADMRETMHAAPGVGLAAPQVGVSLQLAVIEDREEYHGKLNPEQLAARQRRPIAFHVLFNPQIVARDEAKVEFFEGCLSVNGYAAVVPRSNTVTVEFLNQHAEPVRVEASGWYARILQHEIDHLKGALYTDHMHARTLCTVENLERLWKEVPSAAVREKLG